MRLVALLLRLSPMPVSRGGAGAGAEAGVGAEAGTLFFLAGRLPGFFFFLFSVILLTFLITGWGGGGGGGGSPSASVMSPMDNQE